ncbi:MAG: VOC family protein, partial [Streptomyces sp.]
MAVRAARYPEGAPCWADAMLPDVEAGKRFYGELFDWTFGKPMAERDGYTVARRGGRPAAGLLPKPDGRLPTVWNLYLATDDATAALARIRAAGGQVLMNPTDSDGNGVTAVAADPGGAVFSLWQAGAFDGFAVRAQPGTYVWSEVYARDAAVDSFYAEVFGYGMRDVRELGFEEDDAGPEAEFMVWAAAGDPVDEAHAIGGRALIGGTYPAEMPAHFRTYFAVADCD